MMLRWMDMGGSHNLANRYWCTWISSIFCMDMDGYVFTNFLSIDMDGYGFYKPHPCQSLLLGVALHPPPFHRTNACLCPVRVRMRPHCRVVVGFRIQSLFSPLMYCYGVQAETRVNTHIRLTADSGGLTGPASELYCSLTRHGRHDSFFIRINSLSESFDSNQPVWLKMALQEMIQISSRHKMTFWNLFQLDSWLKRFQNVLIQINSRLKKLSRFLIRINSWLKNHLEYWFDSSHDSMIRINCWFRWPFLGLSLDVVDLFGFSLNFADLVGAFTKFRWPFLGIRTSALIRISSWLKQ